MHINKFLWIALLSLPELCWVRCSTEVVTSSTNTPEFSLPLPSASTATIAKADKKVTIRSLEDVVRHPEITKLFRPDDGFEKRDKDFASSFQIPRAIEPNVFYRWEVICPDYLVVLDMNPDPDAYNEINGHRRPSFSGMTQLARRDALRGKLRRCEVGCRCNEHGTIVTGPPTTVRHFSCVRSTYPLKCMHWWNCRCEIKMEQPEVEPGNTVNEYYRALNNVPDHIKLQFPDYEWKISDRFTMSWKSADGRSGGNTNDNERYLVADEKEPYYLEGPTQRNILALDRAGRIVLDGIFAGSASGKLEMFKREIPGEMGPKDNGHNARIDRNLHDT
ncbi:hypothetical protein TWF730_008716 [Orbilia blumenaviensis]|uniref:Uncharacterized protein n=1 Tax=Orbilia blumenaviensis TaxID=1796055 RepID=A0AAV9V3A3_9PEZI